MNTTTIDTPAGPLTIVATDSGAVLAAGFTPDPATLLAATLPAAGLLPVGQQTLRHRPDLGAISKAVEAYLAGDLDRLDEVEVAQPGGDVGTFRAHAWRTLRRLRPGEVVTYTELASRAGRPAAVRAAANACARNAAAPFVPCHRVRRTDGGLGGYRWGVGVKEWLIRHEQVAAGR